MSAIYSAQRASGNAVFDDQQYVAGTCATEVNATTSSAAGNIASTSGAVCIAQIAATTANAVGSIASRSVIFSGTLSPEDIAAIAEAVYTRFLLGAAPVNIVQVNGVTVDGSGAAGDEWGPA